MKLKKVEDGLIEHNNYFIETPIGDLLGDFRGSKTGNTFILYEGRVERPFPHNDFVIIVKKDPKPLTPANQLKLYTRSKDKVYGLLETGKVDNYETNSEWKLVRHEDFIQGYIKNQDQEWVNMGGADVSSDTEFQGFSVEGDTELIMRSYEVYSSPYISLYNVPLDYSAEAFDKDGNSIFEKRYASEEGVIELYVTDVQEGKIILYNTDGTRAYETAIMNLKYGDRFMLVDHDLELRYKGRVLDHHPTFLGQRKELVYLVNTSDRRAYEKTLVSVYNPDGRDEITISLDNVEFSDKVKIPLMRPNHTQDIFVNIKREESKPNDYRQRKFALEIGEY